MTGCSELKTDSSVIVHCWAKVRLRSSVAFWKAFLNSNAMSSVLKKSELSFLVQFTFWSQITQIQVKIGAQRRRSSCHKTYNLQSTRSIPSAISAHRRSHEALNHGLLLKEPLQGWEVSGDTSCLNQIQSKDTTVICGYSDTFSTILNCYIT